MKLEKVTVARADGQGQVGHFKSSSADTYLQLNVNVEINRTYTLHGYIKSAANGTLSCLGKSVATTTSWNHFSMQVVPSSKIFNLVFSPGEYWFYNFKLEKGTIMTQWSPNGEDLVEVKQHIVTMGSSINQLQDKITQKVWMTDVNTATGKVDSHVSTVEQTANKINWLVKSGTDSSNMALTDNAYSLIAQNIDLTGKVKFSSFDSTTQSRLTPLKPTRTWTSKFTTIGTIATCNLSDFNRTPVVGDIFSNTDGGSNTGTWQVTVVNGNSVTIKLLSCDAPAKSAADAASEAAKKAKAISDNIYSTNTTTINGGKITSGSITADQIAAGAITAEKIATDAIKSNNYVANSAGSYLNLKDGTFDSKNFKIDSSGNVSVTGKINATSGTFNGVVKSDNSNTLFSIEMNDGYLNVNGTKDNKSIQIGNIGGYKPTDEQTSNYDTMTIACKYGDGISFDFYSSTDNVYHPKYIINNGRNPDNYIESHIWYGSERHNSLAIFRDLIIDKSDQNEMTLFSSQNSKSLTFSTGIINAKDSWSTNGQSYIINNGRNPNGLTNRHIWYGSEYHGGIAQFDNYVDIFDSALRFYTTQGSVLPDNGRNFVGQIFGSYNSNGYYSFAIGGDVGDQLSLSIKEGNSNGSYISYIIMKEQGLKQKIQFYQPTYIDTLHLGANAVVDSDRRLKKDIVSLNINKSSEFIYSLNPVSYKYKENNSDRFHHGLIAQELKQSMGNDDWGVYVDNSFNKYSSYPMLGIRYEELIPDLIATVQSQNNRINFLEKQIPQLQNQILQLLTQLNSINGGN